MNMMVYDGMIKWILKLMLDHYSYGQKYQL